MITICNLEVQTLVIYRDQAIQNRSKKFEGLRITGQSHATAFPRRDGMMPSARIERPLLSVPDRCGTTLIPVPRHANLYAMKSDQLTERQQHTTVPIF